MSSNWVLGACRMLLIRASQSPRHILGGNGPRRWREEVSKVAAAGQRWRGARKRVWLHCSWDTPGREDQSEKYLMLPAPNSERFILGRLNARHDFQELVWRELRGYFCGHEDRFIFPAVWPGANMFPIVFLSAKEKEGLYLQQTATARKFMLGVLVIHPFLQFLRWGDVVPVLKHLVQSLN